MLEGTIPPWCCSRTSVPCACLQEDSVWIVLGTHLSITVIVCLCIWCQREIRWRLLRLAADFYHKEHNLLIFFMRVVSYISSWWCIWCAFCVFWWAALGGTWWCFGTCEGPRGVLCAALQHEKRWNLLKRAQQRATKMIKGLSYDSRDCSAQRIPKGSLIHVHECLEAGWKIRSWFSYLYYLPSHHTRQAILIQTQLWKYLTKKLHQPVSLSLN